MYNQQELQELISDMKKSNCLIVVEGKNDKKALNELGLNNIITLENKAIYETVEEIVDRDEKVILLTDFDKKGKELYGKIKKYLDRFGVKVDKKYRELLQRNTRLSHIEGFVNYANNLSHKNIQHQNPAMSPDN